MLFEFRDIFAVDVNAIGNGLPAQIDVPLTRLPVQ